jgi:S1-C subfamily serine protease
MASRLGLRGENIPVVSRVDPLSSAARARTAERSRHPAFNGRDVRTIRELERAASGIRTGDVVSLIVIDARATDPLPTIINYRVQ